LSIVSRPILLSDFSGLGKYRVSKIDTNAGFVKSMYLQNTNDRMNKKIITFYSTQSALRTAYMLGEVDYAKGLTGVREQEIDLSKWSNTAITRSTDFTQLVSLFYNNADSNLSSKKARQALNYALPEKFSEGQRADSPIPPMSIYYSKPPNGIISDAEIAREVLSGSGVTFTKPLEISTTADLEEVAKVVAGNWNDLGVKTKITVVDTIPADFQVLLYAYKIPQDPDQYTLWHSDQINNIGHYKNLRIDKLLEDGRVKNNEEERLSIYADFQKYLLDDVPASFLYFPYEYSVSRKF
jgi:peptide/nickel transport system substrate-binding protein